MGDRRIHFTREASYHRALSFVAFKAALSRSHYPVGHENNAGFNDTLALSLSLSKTGMLSLVI